MREIKFRGKDMESYKWVYGNLCNTCGDESGAMCIDCFVVDPATVGQYTGLRDAKGVEICEGDVLGFPNGPKKYFTVSIGDYSDSFTGFSQYGVYSTATDDETVIGLHSNGAEMTVVIGNIFDNPELLGGNPSC